MSSAISTTCYYRNGTVATNDIPCPGSKMCCPSSDSCMDNGLCRDKINHSNGSTTTFPDGHTYNYTGLYYTPSCQDVTYNGCLIDCTTYSSNRGEYIWACNDALTSYCCHLDSDSLGQGDCCAHGTFSLSSPQVLGQTASTTANPTSTISTRTAGTTTSQLASPTVTNSITNTLSPRAKAGIGVGVAAGMIIVSVLAALWYRAYRHARSQGASQVGERGTSELYVKPELDSMQILPKNRESPMMELEAPTQRRSDPAELPVESYKMTDNIPKPAVTGTCHCGKIKYKNSKPSYRMTYCYCSTCRPLHGAPFAAFTNVNREDLEWFKRLPSSEGGEYTELDHTKGVIKELRLSKAATRTFCADCRSPLTMVYHAVPDEIGLVAATIDEGLSSAPVPKVEQHIFVGQKPSWYGIQDDGKVRYDGPTELLREWMDYRKD
ncbi:conserved hypothetical protein [Talaromyces stipitatus ATCC 10500]|uniref:CENP-V/GFA domain-containing protein n=1 Tax=Talaromyces stipitatus (strain ATCC 10500 / CBS 375.48 / QM 6759 / NRRL 1006) TaxID=441959 RepID=B8MK50_TALSN|nr:uncharacterized protein TSTA_043420 [Talaromyces stipitatus ATCC 10500]EED14867.1 conserved hypothetical protein [Talaromyces stipitatus ATCC 10500]